MVARKPQARGQLHCRRSRDDAAQKRLIGKEQIDAIEGDGRIAAGTLAIAKAPLSLHGCARAATGGTTGSVGARPARTRPSQRFHERRLLNRLITTTASERNRCESNDFADSEGVAHWHTPCLKERRGGNGNEEEIVGDGAAGGNGDVRRDAFLNWSGGGSSGLLSAGASCSFGAAAHAGTGIHVGGWVLGQRRLGEWLLGAPGLRICGAVAVLCRAARILLRAARVLCAASRLG